MRTVQLYVNDERVDLFKDEEIQVSSSIQNISDISKVFTDFTQTFTLPASKRNNEIFKYYYQSELENGFEANVRVDARIELDYTPFRTGRLQLESAETQHNQIQNYKVTFYGEVTTLKDLFGEDKLSDVQELNDELVFEYTGSNVQATITSTSDLDIRFPLISSTRTWTYNDAGAEDITLSGNAIDYIELFPAVKVARVFDAIESKYGITFSGLFLTDLRFTNLFTWWKAREIPDFTIASAPLTFPNDLTSTDADGNPVPLPRPVGTSVINVVYNPNYPQYAKHGVWIYTYPTNSATYYLDVFKNGTQLTSYTLSGAQNTLVAFVDNVNGVNDQYTYRVRSDQTITIFGSINYKLIVAGSSPSIKLNITETLSTATLSTNFIDFASSAPDIKVADYFSGVLRMFNLTCYPVGNSTFEIEPLEAWYDHGRDIDITKYTDVKSITYERVKLHKRISFKYVESEAFLNQEFKSLFSREWGSLNNDFNYDGDDLIVEPPFENLQFTNLDGARFQVAHSRTNTPPEDGAYLPKPVMLYLYQSAQTCNFYFDDGLGGTNLITSYVPLGQDVIYNGETTSLNFGDEISSLLLQSVPNSLYNSFYRAYLVNLFNPKNRKVYCTTRLPLGILQDLELNDTLIIRDKKYIINEMKSNLNSGQVDLVLLQDFTTDRADVPPIRPPQVPSTSTGPIVVPIRPPRGKSVAIRGTGTFTTPSVTLPKLYEYTDGDTTVSFTLTTNSGPARTDIYYYDVYNEAKAGGGVEYTKEIIIYQDAGSGFLLAEDGSYLLTEDLQFILQ